MGVSLETLALAKKYTDEHGGGGGSGTSNYNSLSNRPMLAGKVLEGNNTLDYYGLAKKASIDAHNNNYSAAYDSTKSYSIGDYCIRNDILYRNEVPIPTGGEAWNAGHWRAVSVASELKDLQQIKVTCYVNPQNSKNLIFALNPVG